MWDSRCYERRPELALRISAGAVVARLRPDRDDRVLIALTREIDQGQELPGYVLPKGGVQSGESLTDAAHREVEEEAGLSELTILGHLGTGEHVNLEGTRWVHAHYFLATTPQWNGLPTDSAHHFGMDWFPLGALPPLAWKDQHELLARNRRRIREGLQGPRSRL